MSAPGLATLAAAVFAFAADAASTVEVRQEKFLSGGKSIHVEIFAPAGARRSPAVLVLHSSAGTLIGKAELERFSRQLAERGIAAFLVRYFDRTGTIFAGAKSIDELSPVWLETVKDAVDFVAAHRRARAGSIGIFGYSLGAYLAVAESSRDSRIDAVVEVSGGIFSWFDGKLRRLPPLLILHGRADQRVPFANALALSKAARRFGISPQMKIYEGEGHRLSSKASADASARALSFLTRHLQ